MNVPILFTEDCAVFDNSHLLYIGDGEKEKRYEVIFFIYGLKCPSLKWSQLHLWGFLEYVLMF